MARVGTTNLDLGKYLDGENPGSGPQDTTLSGGLNGDKNKIDIALGTAHNTDGSHKAGVIDAANLKSTVVDGSSLEQNTSTKKLNVKALGIVTAMLADDAVTMAKLAADCAGSGLKQNTNGSLSPDVDGTTITVNGSNKLALVGSAVAIPFEIDFAFETGAQFAMCAGRTTGGGLGRPMKAAGHITKISAVSTGGQTYTATGSSAAAADAKIAFKSHEGVHTAYVNGTAISFSILTDDELAFVVVSGAYD